MASDDIPPTPYAFGWALATYRLAISPTRGTLVCGSWLVFHSCPQLRCGFIRWTFSHSSLFLTKPPTITQRALRCLPHSFCLRTTRHHDTHVCTPSISRCPLVPGILGPRCNSLLSHILSRFLSLFFSPRLVFSSILGDYTRVWVPPVPFRFLFFLTSMSR
jgi:hypothetical protein